MRRKGSAMPKRKKVDSRALVEAVESGDSAKDIMNNFGIKTSAQLKSLYVDALVELGRAPGIVVTRGGGDGGGKDRSQSEPREVRVNERGTLIVPRELLDQMGFQIGESFGVYKSPAGVSLKRI
jgi:hypothetical protein